MQHRVLGPTAYQHLGPQDNTELGLLAPGNLGLLVSADSQGKENFHFHTFRTQSVTELLGDFHISSPHRAIKVQTRRSQLN